MTTMQTPPPINPGPMSPGPMSPGQMSPGPMPSGPTPPGQTTLVPLDPSPGYAMRVLPIRANLLPEEITSGRNVRRIRTALIFAMVVVIGALGGWYGLAVSERTAAEDELSAMTSQVDLTRGKTKAKEFAEVTAVIEESEAIAGQLEIALANDLPWSTLYRSLRETGIRGVTVSSISGSLDKESVGADAAAGTAKRAAVLVVQGTAKDKDNVAAYLDAAGKIDGVERVYLTIASAESEGWTFSIKADVSADLRCGRFTTECTTGGK